MPIKEDTEAFANLNQKKGQEFYFFLFEKAGLNKAAKLLIDTSKISKDKGSKEANVKDMSQAGRMARGKMCWSEDGNLMVTPVKGAAKLREDVRKAVKNHAIAKPKDVIVNPEEEDVDQQQQTSGQSGQVEAAKLAEAVETLITSVNEESRKRPKEARSIAQGAKDTLVRLETDFNAKHPNSEHYPKDTVERGHQEFDKVLQQLERKKGEQGQEFKTHLGDVKERDAAAKLRELIKEELKKAIKGFQHPDPKEGLRILENAKAEMTTHDEDFKKEYPDSKNYPKVDVEQALGRVDTCLGRVRSKTPGDDLGTKLKDPNFRKEKMEWLGTINNPDENVTKELLSLFRAAPEDDVELRKQVFEKAFNCAFTDTMAGTAESMPPKVLNKIV